MSTFTSVLQPPVTDNQAFLGKNGKGSQMSWYSVLTDPNFSKSYSPNGSGYVSDPNLDFLTDYLSTTSYVAQDSGDLYLRFDKDDGLSFPFECNHISIGGLNFESADITEVTLSLNVNGIDFSINKSINTSSRATFFDGKPLMLMLDGVYNTVQLLVIIKTGSAQVSNVKLATIYAGRTIEFPTQPAIGFKKGSWNTNDEPRFSRRQNNAFGASTVKRQGTEEKVTIPVVPIEFMDNEWKDFVRTYEYVPVFFSWSLLDFPLDTIYGNLSFQDASFSSSLYSQLSFNVRGVV